MLFSQIEDIVLAYPKEPTNKFVDDPVGDESAPVNPPLPTMPADTYAQFYTDFHGYLIAKGVQSDIGLFKLKNCVKWEDVAGYVYGMQ